MEDSPLHLREGQPEGGEHAAMNVHRDAERDAEMLAELQQNLGNTLADASCIDEALCKSLGAAIRATGMDCGGIYLVDDVTGSLDLVFHSGLPPRFAGSASHYDSNSANTQFVMAGDPIFTQHQELDVPIDDIRRREGLQAFAVLPILHQGRVVGCLNMASHKYREVPRVAREALKVIAAHMGSAIVRLKTEE
jgi:two-component system cell cycle sensor histidine kinase/response regulator CckA